MDIEKNRIIKCIKRSPELKYPLYLKGNPPVVTCTICVREKEIGWKEHFGVLRPFDGDMFYRGE